VILTASYAMGELPIPKYLQYLADDLVIQIVRFLDAQSIHRLTHTCPMMRERLENGNIVKTLDFKGLMQLRGFPKFVSGFSRLCELVLILPVSTKHFLRFKQSVLYSLPKSLLKLHFHFLGAHGIWFEGFEVTSSVRFSVAIHPMEDEYIPLDLLTIIPRVQELRLGGENRMAALKLVSALPPSATSFIAYNCIRSPETNLEMSQLPPNLKTLKGKWPAHFTAKALDTPLPPLETLELNIYEPEKCFSSLPKTLTKLSLDSFNPETWQAADFGWLAPLVNLTYLDVPSPLIVPYLTDKAHLKTLKLSRCPLLPAQVRLLPRSLTSLIFGPLLDLAHVGTAYDFWPSRLKTLKFKIEMQDLASPELLWLSVPKSLTSFNVIAGPENYSVPIPRSYFTPAIKSICWNIGDVPEVDDFGCFKNVTSISLNCFNWNDSYTHKIILPDQLRHFSWVSWVDKPFKMTTDEFIFPSNLHSFEMNGPVFNDAALQRLPRCLQKLYLHYNSNQESLITDEGLLNLPPQLTELHLVISPNSDVNRFFPKLPRHLTILKLYGPEHIDDAIIGELPKCLQRLELTSVTNLTDAALSHLPPSLTHLGLPNNQCITPEAFFAHFRSTNLQFFDFRRNPLFLRSTVLSLAPPLMGYRTRLAMCEWSS
jgi:hypothetical protein